MNDVSNGHNNVIFGFQSVSSFDNCLILGDNCQTTCDGEVVVGSKLYGKEIPENLKALISNDPEAFKWFARSLASALMPILG